MSLGRKVVVAALASATIASPAARADTGMVPSLRISAGIGHSTNPFLAGGTDLAATSIDVDIRPSLDLRSERDQMHIEAHYSRSEYLNKYGSTYSAGALVDASTRLSERANLRTTASFESEILGVAGAFVAPRFEILPGSPPTGGGLPPPVTPVTPVAPPGFEDGDIGLIGLRQRRNQLSLSAVADLQAGPRASWTINANASKVTYPNERTAISDYRSLGAGVGYSRVLSERMTLGGRLNGYIVDYRQGATSKVLTPEVLLTHRFAPRWTLEAAAGVSLVDAGRNVTPVTASVTACHEGETDRFCAMASRAPSITGFSGVRTQTSLGATYQRRLSEPSRIAAAVSYTRLGAGELDTSRAESFLSASATYEHDVARNVAVLLAANYRDLHRPGSEVKDDLAARAGIAVRFGANR